MVLMRKGQQTWSLKGVSLVENMTWKTLVVSFICNFWKPLHGLEVDQNFPFKCSDWQQLHQSWLHDVDGPVIENNVDNLRIECKVDQAPNLQKWCILWS